MRKLLVVAVTVAAFFAARNIYGSAELLLVALLVTQIVAPAPPQVAIALVVVTTVVMVGGFAMVGALANPARVMWELAWVVYSTAIFVLAALVAVSAAQVINRRRAERPASP